jgi:hypothetical protein
MPLTDTAIRNAKPGEKPIKLFDERGLYLEISPTGGKWWRLKYRFGGREKRLSLGVYPDVGLKDARDRRDAQTGGRWHRSQQKPQGAEIGAGRPGGEQLRGEGAPSGRTGNGARAWGAEAAHQASGVTGGPKG